MLRNYEVTRVGGIPVQTVYDFLAGGGSQLPPRRWLIGARAIAEHKTQTPKRVFDLLRRGKLPVVKPDGMYKTTNLALDMFDMVEKLYQLAHVPFNTEERRKCAPLFLLTVGICDPSMSQLIRTLQLIGICSPSDSSGSSSG